MPDSIPNNWEPDPRQVGKNWRSMFEQPQRDGEPLGQSTPPPTARNEQSDDADRALDLTEYKPWIVQRVRSRPALMLELRRYEPRSGLWQGWAMPYHSLYAVEYLGDRMLSLDFGTRHFVIEGQGLDELSRHIQHGTIEAVIEYSSQIWKSQLEPKTIISIKSS